MQKAREFLERMATARAAKGDIKQKNPLQKWHESDKTSRSLAIHANCLECVGCSPTETASGYRDAIRSCHLVDCPLHVFRPYRRLFTPG